METKNRRKSFTAILIAAIFGCGAMLFTDGVWQPGYAVKSAVKIAVFLIIPLLISKADQNIQIKPFLRFSKKGIKTAFALGAGIYAVILGGYFILSEVIDFSNIASSLSANAGVTKENFIFVSLYISFINSLLEEFFFRGFVFLNLKNTSGRKTAYFISAFAFAVYHTAMMTGWFNVFVFALMLFGLFAGGIIFNILNEKQGNIYTSWFVHMFANFAINTVGFILLTR